MGPIQKVKKSFNLLKKARKNDFENESDYFDLQNNKKLLTVIKTFFRKKTLNSDQLILVEKRSLIFAESVLANKIKIRDYCELKLKEYPRQ